MNASLPLLTLALAQMTSVDDWEINLKSIQDLLETAPKKATLFCFPENAFYMRLNQKRDIPTIGLDHPVVQFMETWCGEHDKSVLIGASPITHEGQKFNATLLFEPQKAAQIVYKKIHLFDVDVAGEKKIRESDDFVCGESPAIVKIGGWQFGLSICYDLRFSELYSHYQKQGVQVLFVPAAFLQSTGQAHWEILLRARAIENQCYVLAPAQAGEHQSVDGSLRHTFGHTMAVNPWGGVVEQMSSGSGWIQVTLDSNELEKVKGQIPMHQHRKDNLF